jgi:hypothetical protein
MRETMRPRGATVAALLLLVAAAVFASPPVPARVLAAQYVALGFDLGDRFLSASEAIGHPDRVTSEDRKALEAVREGLEKWDRYVIESHPAHAEILIVVRVGRRMRARIGDLGGPPASSERGGGVELSSQGDMLSVYEAGGGPSPALLWRAQRVDGFSGPAPALLEQFKAEVEASARKP